MSLWANVRNDDDFIITVKSRDNFDPATVDHKFGPTFAERIIPIETLPPEAYDPDIEILGRVETVEATRVTRQLKKRAMTTQEQERYDLSKESDNQKAFAEQAYASMKSGNVPNGEQVRKLMLYLVGRQLYEE